jgi:hypothetical protein
MPCSPRRLYVASYIFTYLGTEVLQVDKDVPRYLGSSPNNDTRAVQRSAERRNLAQEIRTTTQAITGSASPGPLVPAGTPASVLSRLPSASSVIQYLTWMPL